MQHIKNIYLLMFLTFFSFGLYASYVPSNNVDPTLLAVLRVYMKEKVENSDITPSTKESFVQALKSAQTPDDFDYVEAQLFEITTHSLPISK